MVSEGLPVGQGSAHGGIDGASGEEFRGVACGVREAVQDGHHAPRGAFEDDRQGAEVETSVQHDRGSFYRGLPGGLAVSQQRAASVGHAFEV